MPLSLTWFSVLQLNSWWYHFMTTKVSSPWGAFLGLAWSGTENVWEDGSAWDYQNFGQGQISTFYKHWKSRILWALSMKSFFTDSIESASCFKLGFNPDGSWSSVAAEKCFDTRNQPTDCFCKRPVWVANLNIGNQKSRLLKQLSCRKVLQHNVRNHWLIL